jgi:hypothetical protein
VTAAWISAGTVVRAELPVEYENGRQGGHGDYCDCSNNHDFDLKLKMILISMLLVT